MLSLIWILVFSQHAVRLSRVDNFQNYRMICSKLEESSRFQLLDYICVVYLPLLEGYSLTFIAEYASFPNIHSSLLC